MIFSECHSEPGAAGSKNLRRIDDAKILRLRYAPLRMTTECDMKGLMKRVWICRVGAAVSVGLTHDRKAGSHVEHGAHRGNGPAAAYGEIHHHYADRRKCVYCSGSCPVCDVFAMILHCTKGSL